VKRDGDLDVGSRRRIGVEAQLRSTRRRLLAVLIAGLVATSSTTLAQVKRPAKVGWLNFGSRAGNGHFYATFRDAMTRHGWREGTDYIVVERWADNRRELLNALARELAAANPDVIVAWPNSFVAEAIKAAPTTPLVQATGADPVKEGYAASLAHPGGMVTGLTNFSTDLAEKYLELLLAAAPTVQDVGFLFTNSSRRQDYEQGVRRSLSPRHVKAYFGVASSIDEIESALAAMANQGARALVVTVNPLFFGARDRITAFALARKWPMIGFAREFAETGGLLSYGPNLPDCFAQAARYVDRILKGAKPGDLPFEQPTRLELVISRKTAGMLGIAIPNELLVRADKVIE